MGSFAWRLPFPEALRGEKTVNPLRQVIGASQLFTEGHPFCRAGAGNSVYSCPESRAVGGIKMPIR